MRLALVLAQLLFSSFAVAKDYTLPGSLPPGCSSSSATSFSCSNVSLDWNDRIVVVNANTTLTIAGTLTANGNEFNTSSPTGGFTISARTVSGDNYLNLNGNLSATGSLTLSSNSNNITGNVSAGGVTRVGGKISGSLTTSGALSTEWATSVGGNVSAKSIATGGGGTYSGSLTATGGDISVGGADKVTGTVTATGALTTGSGVTIGGALRATSITSGGNGTYNGNLTATSGDISGGSSDKIGGTVTAAGTLTTGSATTIGGAVSAKSIESGGGSSYNGGLTATGGGITLGSSDVIKGAVAASGDITTGSANTINGNVSSSGGSVTLRSANTAVVGSVTAGGDVVLGSGSSVSLDVTSGGRVTLNSSNSSVGGSVVAGGDVVLGSGTSVALNVTSRGGSVTLNASNARVGGNVTASRAVTLESGTQVVGSVTSSSSDVELKDSSASVGKCISVKSSRKITLGHAASVGGVCCNNGGVCSSACVVSNIDWTHPIPPLCSSSGGAVNADHFNCVEPGANAATGRLYTKLVGAGFSVDVVALKADGDVETGYASDGDKSVTVELVDGAGATACSARSAISPAVSQSLLFTSAEQGRKASASLVVGKAYADLRCRVTDTSQSPSLVSCSTDNFALRPQSINSVKSSANADATGSSASNKPVVKAGAAFTLTAGTNTEGYSGTPAIDPARIEWLNTPAGGRAAPGAGTLAGEFTTAATASTGDGASGSAFTYSEVGYFRFQAQGVYDSSFVASSGDSANADCTDDFSNSPVGGKYGCKFGNSVVTDYFGRFVPDHFAISPGNVAVACGAFTYFGQDGFTTPFTLIAQNKGNATTQNYSGAYARLALGNWSNFSFSPSATLPEGATLAASATAPSGSWLGGVAAVSAKHQISRPSALAGQTSVTLSALPKDSDGVTLAAASAVQTASTALRYGRLRLFNAYGSDKAALQLPLQVQYWSGKSWVINSADTCTVDSLKTSAFALYPAGVATSASALTLSDGSGALTLAQPSPRASGYVDVAANLGTSGNDQSCLTNTKQNSTAAGLPWLRAQNGSCATTYDRDPSARASFGVYSAETRRTVHIREAF